MLKPALLLLRKFDFKNRHGGRFLKQAFVLTAIYSIPRFRFFLVLIGPFSTEIADARKGTSLPVYAETSTILHSQVIATNISRQALASGSLCEDHPPDARPGAHVNITS